MSNADDIEQYPNIAKGVDGHALLARMEAEGKQNVYIRFGEPSPTPAPSEECEAEEWRIIGNGLLQEREEKLKAFLSRAKIELPWPRSGPVVEITTTALDSRSQLPQSAPVDIGETECPESGIYKRYSGYDVLNVMNSEWSDISNTRLRKLSENVRKNNALLALIGYGRSTEEVARRRARNQRRALKRWRAREARRNSAASAVVLSTPALAAACGLPEPGAPDDILAAIRDSARSR